MNKQQQKAFLKRQLLDLEDQEELFKQGLSSITSRKMYLESELRELGDSSAPAPRSQKYQLKPEQKQALIASLTKGSQLSA